MMRELLSRTYFGIDPRSLGLFRILFAAVLLVDLFAHFDGIDFWYTDAGLLPGADLLAHPPTPRVFSLFFLTGSHAGVAIGMSLCGAVYLGLALGWRTRWFQWLAFLCVISLNGRVALLNNGGDTVLNLLAMWTLALPLGRRFSLDSLFRSLRDHDERSAEQLERRADFAPAAARVHSLAVLALLLQFSFIYLFSAIQKSGFTWMEGTAVHYSLHQDRIVTVLGVWLRELSPEPLMAVAGWGTLLVEGVAPVLLLSPLWTSGLRGVAIALLPTMHLVFRLSLTIGSFSYAMMSFFPLLLTTEHWDALSRAFARRTRRRTVFFDSDCGICFLTVRVLARLDAFERLQIFSNQREELLPAGISAEHVQTTVVVVDSENGAVYTRSAAVSQALRALPLGFALAIPMRIPGIRALLDALYDAVSRNRTAISARVGLAACGIPLPPTEAEPETPPTPGPRSALTKYIAEAAVAVMMLACWGQLVHDNFAFPRALRYRQPGVLQALIDYPRLVQGWRMFTPEGPPQEFMLVVEAETAEGRKVDPFNEVASRHSEARFTRIPKRLGFDTLFGTYSEAAARGDLWRYQPALVRWVLAYPERTGDPDDRIVAFELVKLSDISPAPGRLKATNHRREVLLRYPPVEEGE
jgi:predicted DCC family thiol-disulfide oxidoreductase YuxK